MSTTTKPRLCDWCSHSRAAHVDGTHCALCGCSSRERSFVQESFSFRIGQPVRAAPNTRKR